MCANQSRDSQIGRVLLILHRPLDICSLAHSVCVLSGGERTEEREGGKKERKRKEKGEGKKEQSIRKQKTKRKKQTKEEKRGKNQKWWDIQ